MKNAIGMAVLLMASFALAQSNQPNQPSNNHNQNGEVTVRGCVTMLNGDYVLTKQDPANTYQLQKADHIKLRSYLGQRVEITGTKSETIPSSEDAINGRLGSASPVSITVKSIKTLSKECRE
jgi:hypothetical protein